MKPSVYVSVATGLLILHAVGTGAEEYLFKPSGKYLGWKVPENKFKACDESVLEIEDGRIEKTSDKCRKDRIPGPYVELVGALEFANSNSGILRIVGGDGKSIELYLPPDSESWPELKQLPKGTLVKVTGPVPGRAEAVMAESGTKALELKDLPPRRY